MEANERYPLPGIPDTIGIGTGIYYPGDTVSLEGFGTVTRIDRNIWYGQTFHVTLEDGRRCTFHPFHFQGPRPVLTRGRYDALQAAKMEALKKAL